MKYALVPPGSVCIDDGKDADKRQYDVVREMGYGIGRYVARGMYEEDARLLIEALRERDS
jgi:hypothetical protein